MWKLWYKYFAKKSELKTGIWKTSKSVSALTGCSHTPHSHRRLGLAQISTDTRHRQGCFPQTGTANHRVTSLLRTKRETGEEMLFPAYHFVLVLPLLLSPTLSKTCCSSPKPSQPILCSSRNSCILRGLGNTSGTSAWKADIKVRNCEIICLQGFKI